MTRIKLHQILFEKITKVAYSFENYIHSSKKIHTQNKTLVQFVSYGFMKLILNKNVDEII